MDENATVHAVEPQADIVCLNCRERQIRRYGDFNYYLGCFVGMAIGIYLYRTMKG